mmetsp:Transcript_140547/g.255472  ORF Transcript_140547/g.255472 Transcript_140547/m.255472 type:complete len:329 (+) Transcript_140547:1255-2241(+)
MGFHAYVLQRRARCRLELWVLRQRDSDGVTESIKEKCANTGCRLNAAISTTSSFCDSKMQRIVPAKLVHLFCKCAVSLNHDPRIRCLHAEDEVMKIQFAADFSKLNCRCNHALRTVAVLEEDSLGQGAMVDTNAHGLVLLLQLQNQWCKNFFNFCPGFFDILVSQLGQCVKRLPSVCKVAGIHADLVHVVSNLQGNLRCEVDVCNEWGFVAILQEFALDVLASLRFLHALHSDSDHIDSCISTPFDLSHCCIHIISGCGCHCLCDYWVVPANWHLANVDGPGFPPSALFRIRAIDASWTNHYLLLHGRAHVHFWDTKANMLLRVGTYD